MTRIHCTLLRCIVGPLCLASTPLPNPAAQPSDAQASLQSALTIYASFDQGPKADFALGDPTLYHAPSWSQRASATAGLPPSGEMSLVPGSGRFGQALRFHKKKAPLLFFRADKNVPYHTNAWSGTVSFWLSLDPETELEPGYTDPIQITPRAWNDAAFFVEFSKDEKPRHFRLGAYADYKVWNPQDRKWEEIPFPEKPLVSVTRPPFRHGQWTHVLFTWEQFNSGQSNGVARLYLDGRPQGTLSARRQTFTWDPSQTCVMLGLSYIGLWDELAVFNRALAPDEVKAFHEFNADQIRALCTRK